MQERHLKEDDDDNNNNIIIISLTWEGMSHSLSGHLTWYVRAVQPQTRCSLGEIWRASPGAGPTSSSSASSPAPTHKTNCHHICAMYHKLYKSEKSNQRSTESLPPVHFITTTTLLCPCSGFNKNHNKYMSKTPPLTNKAKLQMLSFPFEIWSCQLKARTIGLRCLCELFH